MIGAALVLPWVLAGCDAAPSDGFETAYCAKIEEARTLADLGHLETAYDLLIAADAMVLVEEDNFRTLPLLIGVAAAAGSPDQACSHYRTWACIQSFAPEALADASHEGQDAAMRACIAHRTGAFGGLYETTDYEAADVGTWRLEEVLAMTRTYAKGRAACFGPSAEDGPAMDYEYLLTDDGALMEVVPISKF